MPIINYNACILASSLATPAFDVLAWRTSVPAVATSSSWRVDSLKCPQLLSNLLPTASRSFATTEATESASAQRRIARYPKPN